MYEGFATDLIREISRKCKFRYEIDVVDMENGKEDAATGQWSGIIGEIVNKVRKMIDQDGKWTFLMFFFFFNFRELIWPLEILL